MANVMAGLAGLFTGPGGYLPHAVCFLGQPDLIWLHVSSDAVIAVAYFLIPLTLAMLMRRVRITSQYNWAIGLFAAFILLCGLSHLFDVLVVWVPVYRLQGWEKALTALVSLATAFATIPLVPQLAQLKSPKELEEANRRLAAEIERREHAERDLKRSVADLNRALQELEQFAYITSHDLQTPLRSIAGFSQLMQRRYRERLDGDALEFLDFIEKGCVQMQHLIRDLLTLSRIGRGGPPRFDRQPLDKTLRRVLQTMKPQIEQSGARIDYGSLPDIVADHALLGQLLQNLVGNAIKFHRNGVVPVIRVDAQLERDSVRVDVSDNGIGVPQDQLENIFVLFRRLQQSEAYEGTGIGLAVCRKIAAHHGGEIWATSDGNGTQFHLRLPLNPGGTAILTRESPAGLDPAIAAQLAGA